MNPIVILGSGLAGYSLLREIRKRDADVPVSVITADDGTAYAKPNLSNALAAGKSATQLAGQSAEQVARAQNAIILTHTRAEAIDPVARQVLTDRGAVDYDRLVLAMGADPFPHGLEGDAAGEVLSVNDLADYTRFREVLAEKKRVTVIGGGLIGCEFANDLVASGHAVDVVHMAGWPLERLVPEAVGRALSVALASRGVTWHFGVTAKTAQRQGDTLKLVLSDGGNIETDVVLSAIGLRPRVSQAFQAGLAVNRGIVTDAFLGTSVAGIHAMGDCAEVRGQVLPYVQPLLVQARALAATLTGTPTAVAYPPMPVVVKTPACPLAVLPPPPGAAGTWTMDEDRDGMEAGFRNETGQLLGFALTGAHTGKRALFAQKMAQPA